MKLELKADKLAVAQALDSKAEVTRVEEVAQSIKDIEKKLTEKIDLGLDKVAANAAEAAENQAQN